MLFFYKNNYYHRIKSHLEFPILKQLRADALMRPLPFTKVVTYTIKLYIDFGI
jgi:hypothetical protein